jgi:3-isopropylmalate/(R)-2-methylmalate dehydratase small subunit
MKDISMNTENAPIIDNVTGTAIPLVANDVDTDRIIPARFMRCVTFDGLGEYAFYDERFDEEGNPKKHPMNDDMYNGGSILIVGSNFGCGSSREHAPQALLRYGIKGIIGISYADIFAGNCVSLGMPAVKTDATSIAELASFIESNPKTIITIDLTRDLILGGPQDIPLNIDKSAKTMLTEGLWDTTALLSTSLEEVENTATSIHYLN